MTEDEKKELMTKFDLSDTKKIQKAYDTLYKAKKGIIISKSNTKEFEKEIKEEVASSLGLYDKKNNPKTSEVKFSILKKAMNVSIEENFNKLEEELDLQTEYIELIKKDSAVKNKCESYLRKKEVEAEAKIELKETISNLHTHIDTEIVESLEVLAERMIENNKKDILGEEEKDKKPKKIKDDNTSIKIISFLKSTLTFGEK